MRPSNFQFPSLSRLKHTFRTLRRKEPICGKLPSPEEIKTHILRHKRRYAWSVIVFVLFTVYMFSLPRKLFDKPTCTVIDDREGRLLGAKIAADGQWRFPAADSVPYKYAKALVLFEDKRF